MTTSNTQLPGAGAVPASNVSIDDSHLPLVCFSHLRWSFVWQRPQHLLTRIARQHPVYLIEEPRIHETDDAPHLAVSKESGITILTPSLPRTEGQKGGFTSRNNALIRTVLAKYFRHELSSPEVIAWYYTPMSLGALPAELHAVITVYDAMDELANFRGAPRELRDRERALMQRADLVFAGGPSLHESRKFRHPRAFCFPSGVDAAHFGARDVSCPEDIFRHPAPIVGFYGVLDERVDFDLVAGIADLRPDWTILMIGPVAKIEESDLAHRPNIHYPGMRSYNQLPHYLSRFDVAILPFALNEATQFISPTKTLEYMAGGKPIVSTAIRDVVDLYGEVVEVARTAEEFVEAIEMLWNESREEQAARSEKARALLTQHGWDTIAGRMMELIHEVRNNRSTFAALLQETIVQTPPTAPASPAFLQEVAD